MNKNKFTQEIYNWLSTFKDVSSAHPPALMEDYINGHERQIGFAHL